MYWQNKNYWNLINSEISKYWFYNQWTFTSLDWLKTRELNNSKWQDITFADLWISEKILKKIEIKKFTAPTLVQAKVIPLLLNWEKDIIAQAQTGSWKTASFVIPILEKLNKNLHQIQALILTPTRELAIQIADDIKSFADNDTKIQLLYWWQNMWEELRWLKKEPHIIVGTPGRVIDHLTKKWSLDISKIQYFVLDEADEMLNIWFKEDIEEIIRFTPEDKKVLLFSATMPKWILDIVHKYIKNHDKISIKKEEITNADIFQKWYKVREQDKFEALCRVIEVEFDFYGILFCKTKNDVDEIAAKLLNRGYKVEWIHGDIEQKMREKTLARFKNGTIKILVATDVAARGIDVQNLTHVINYSLPDNPETYTHRIGRTGRAGKKWEAISFITRKDNRILSRIERSIKMPIKIEKLPEIPEVIEFKKKRLVENIKKSLENVENLHYIDLAKDLLEIWWKPEEILASILQEWYWEEFSTTHYADLKPEIFEDSSFWKRKWQRWYSWIVWQRRLFVAKWRLDWFTPWSLIKFIEKETWDKLWDVGNIDIMREFSFINLSESDADFVLRKFRELAKWWKSVVVEAKQREWWFERKRSSGWFKWKSGEFRKERKRY